MLATDDLHLHLNLHLHLRLHLHLHLTLSVCEELRESGRVVSVRVLVRDVCTSRSERSSIHHAFEPGEEKLVVRRATLRMLLPARLLIRTADTDTEPPGAGAPHVILFSGWRTHRGSDSNTMLRVVFIRCGFAMSFCILVDGRHHHRVSLCAICALRRVGDSLQYPYK